MQVDRFFSSTRGKIVAQLRERGSASAAELAGCFGLSPNAIRQQLVVLERDGPTKPTLEFSLTPKADSLFPQQYDKMLAAVLREVKALHGAPAVEQIFDRIGQRAVERAKTKVTAGDAEGRVAQLTQVLRDQGVVAEYSLIDGGFLLQEHTCPYSGVVQEHPEVCAVIHQVMDETLGGEHQQIESLASGGKSCTFALKGVQVS
jgi:predicted ArsR family transcriptional regulator